MSAVPAPGAHGGDGARVAAALGLDPATVLDLSASLNPVAPDPVPTVARAVAAGALHRYPDPETAAAGLAEAMGVRRDELLLTNGGSEAIALVAAEVGGHVDEPDFALYPRNPQDGGPRWRSNPHNPSGRLADRDERSGVWDEAFWPLARGTWTRGDHRDDSVVVGSLTKLLACPGLRLGYVLSGDAELLARLRRRQPAWSVNGMATAALPDLLSTVDLGGWAEAVRALRRELVADLGKMGLAVRDTDACWVLIERAEGLRASLARHGVVVRDCSSFGWTGTVRVAVPDDEGRQRLLAVLETALEERSEGTMLEERSEGTMLEERSQGTRPVDSASAASDLPAAVPYRRGSTS